MNRQAGFSLLEAMIALSVLSIAVLALMKAGEEDIRTVAYVEEKEIASILVENKLNEMLLRPVVASSFKDRGNDRLADRDWVWEVSIVPTSKSGIVKVQVRAYLKGEEQVLAELTGFRRVKS